MFERNGLTPQQGMALEKRFDVARDYWTRAVSDGRAERTRYFTEVFDGPETEIYREMGDDEFLFIVAKTLNETWKGDERWKYRSENHPGLPTSPTPTPTSTSGGTSAKS